MSLFLAQQLTSRLLCAEQSELGLGHTVIPLKQPSVYASSTRPKLFVYLGIAVMLGPMFSQLPPDKRCR